MRCVKAMRIVRRSLHTTKRFSDIIMMPEVKMVALVTKRKNFLIPSADNTFGQISYDKVKLDSGCSSMLLPLFSTKDIELLLSIYPPTNGYNWRLTESKAIGKLNFSLVITPICKASFPICLARDHFKGTTCSVPGLRYFLSSADLDYLLGQNIEKLMLGATYNHAVEHIKKHRVVERRNYALLGQSFLSQFHTISTPECCFYIDTAKTPNFSNFCGGSWEHVADTAFRVRMAAEGSSDEVVRLLEEAEDVLQDKEGVDRANWSDEPLPVDEWDDNSPFITK